MTYISVFMWHQNGHKITSLTLRWVERVYLCLIFYRLWFVHGWDNTVCQRLHMQHSLSIKKCSHLLWYQTTRWFLKSRLHSWQGTCKRGHRKTVSGRHITVWGHPGSNDQGSRRYQTDTKGLARLLFTKRQTFTFKSKSIIIYFDILVLFEQISL